MDIELEIDKILSEDKIVGDDVKSMLQKYKTTSQDLNNTNRQIESQKNKINSSLASAILSYNSKLKCTLANGCLLVTYGNHSNRMIVKPDLDNDKWMVGDSAFERRFQKYNEEKLSGTEDELALAIAKYFRVTYKSLKENIEND